MDWSASMTNIPRADLAETFGIEEAEPTNAQSEKPKPDAWKPTTQYTIGDQIVDSHNNIRICETAGESGSEMPTWETEKTSDGSVAWSLVEPDSKPTAAPPSHAPVKHRLVTVPVTLSPSAQAQFDLARKIAVDLAKGVKGNAILVSMHGTSSDSEPQTGFAPEQLSVIVSRAAA